MYSLYVGIDISKLSFHAAMLSGNNTVVDLGCFTNDYSGFENLIVRLKQESKCEKNEWFICFENTGTYSKSLLEWLVSQQIPCREENALRISRSMGLRRGKDDKVDARDICVYAFRHRDTLKPTQLTKPGISRLRKLLSRRSFVIRQKHGCQVSLKEQKSELDVDLNKIMSDQNDRLLQLYNEQLTVLEKLIRETIEKDPAMKKNDQLAQSVKGIGPITSAFIIAHTHNFERFENARQFACYSGIAPFPNRSGTSLKGKTRVSPFGNKQLKALLSNCANAAIAFDKELKSYYLRKKAEGKEYGTVLNAVKNKLVQRVFAVIKRQSPYVPLMNYT
ncbi:MAG: IS110 family transposase [Flavobacteriaceae bacterium]|nr:IS110 family transposase [Flavobacteriaceae bacterium]